MTGPLSLNRPVTKQLTGVHRESDPMDRESLLTFIWKQKVNKLYLFAALIGTILQFLLFKSLYPFPDFFSDSYSYLYAASANLDVSIWPIGYSKFLRLFHFLSNSDTSLITFQYFFLEISSLYLFFSVLKFFNPVRSNQIILFAFLFCNPLFLYLSNYVNSDPLFVALSLLWFTQLLLIIRQPKPQQLISHAFLLFLCFTVRNNAYYYPIVSLAVFLLSNQSWSAKISGILLPFLLIIPFVIHTQKAAAKLTGVKQFSLFTGWQLANNALYMFEYADSATTLSSQSSELDQLTRHFYKYRGPSFHENISHYVGNYFIRETASPLKQYMLKHYKITDQYSETIAWGKSSAVFTEYGTYLITHNLGAYAWEYALPNVKNYIFPPLEKLEIYNLGLDNVDGIAQSWFKYNNGVVTSVSKRAQGIILYFFPLLFCLLNCYLIIATIIYYSKQKGQIQGTFFKKAIIIGITLELANFSFLTLSTEIVFRYQIFPMIVCLVIALLLTEKIHQPTKSYANARRP